MDNNAGLVDDERWRIFSEKREAVEKEQQRLKSTWLQAATVPDDMAQKVLGNTLKKEASLLELLRRPEVSYTTLLSLPGAGEPVADPQVAEQVEIQAKYQGYIERQQGEIEKQKRHEQTKMPANFDYNKVTGLSVEVCQKLDQYKPATIGQASRISGVTPAAISLLLVHLKKRSHAA